MSHQWNSEELLTRWEKRRSDVYKRQMLTRLYVRAIPEARHLIETWLDTAAGRCPWDDLYRYTFGSKYVPREEEQR